MAEMWVRVENPPSDPLYAVPTVNPAIKGTYIHSIAAVPGTVAAQNFMTLFNPVGSGKTLSLVSLAISASNTTPSTEVTPLRGWRITAAPTGGTLVMASSVVKFKSTQPDPIGVVRVGNPTATPIGAIFNSPPPLDNRSSTVHSIDLPPGVGPFVLAPGEGTLVRKEAGVTSVSWNVSIVWAEI